MKKRILITSKPLRAEPARQFKESNKDLFNGKYLFTGKYHTSGYNTRYPLYVIVREIPKDFPYIEDHTSVADERELFDTIPVMSVREGEKEPGVLIGG